MNGKQKFYKDLETGNYGERIVAEYLCQKYNWTIIKRNNDKLYDFMLWTDDGKKTFEVKTDMFEVYNGITNNMIIETKCSGKLSGISATKADYFIYYYPHWQMFYFIETDKLRVLMNERGDLFRKLKTMGDDGRATGYIANRFAVMPYFTIYNLNWQLLKQIKKKIV
jgi:uncharacterized MAPEG superfamily protein